VQPPQHQPPANAPAQRRAPPPANAPAQVQPQQPPANAPAQVQPPPNAPPANAPVQNQRRQGPPNAPAQNQPPNAPVQAAPAVAPRQPPPAAAVAPPALPVPSAAQAKPLQRTQGPAAIMLTSPQGQPVRRVDQLRSERHEVREGNRLIIREPDRVIVREANGQAFIRHSDVDRFRYGARDVRVETRGRDNVTTIVLPNGQRVVTVLDGDGRLLRRSRFLPNGREVVIINQRPLAPGFSPFVTLPPPIVRIPRERYIVDLEGAPPALVYDTLMAPPVEPIDQPYTLDQVRYSYSLRERMPSIDIDTINFETGSWEVAPDQVDRLAAIADGINRAIQANPQEVFMIEGHTDAVGNDVDNLSLSDRRAETVALIMSDKFGVPAENMVTQGYGEQYLKIPSDGPERRNRRVTVRRITPLLEQQAGGPPPGPPPGGPQQQ
jgi:outer membrane protein OmpA-like peptidoglycan-associated protein